MSSGPKPENALLEKSELSLSLERRKRLQSSSCACDRRVHASLLKGYVSEQLTMSYDRKQIILERNEISEGLSGKYVDLYEFPDGKLEVRSKGHSLPYRLFSKDQRVSHTAVVENKRLSHALTIIKKQQEVKREPKVKNNSEKIGYKKRPRQVYGPDYKEKITPGPAVEMTA
jgi:hypothetical protein